MYLDSARVGMNDLFMMKIQAVDKLDINICFFTFVIVEEFRIAGCSSVVYDEDSVPLP